MFAQYLVAILTSLNWLAVYCTEKASYLVKKSKIGWGTKSKSGQTYLPH